MVTLLSCEEEVMQEIHLTLPQGASGDVDDLIFADVEYLISQR